MVSFEVYLRQCSDFIRLQAWYVWHLHVRCRKPHADIFGNALVRYLYGDRTDNPAWRELELGILEQCRRHGARAHTRELEDRVLARVRTFVDDTYIADTVYARYRKNHGDASPFCGFTFDVDGERLQLHFTNTFDPDSPFRHPQALHHGLARLLERARTRHPKVSKVVCGTWLNSLPPFLSLFPSAWRTSAETAPPAGHGGWWGQFTDRTGNLHRGNAEHLRRTGSFRHPFLRCSCTLKGLRRYLAASGPRVGREGPGGRKARPRPCQSPGRGKAPSLENDGHDLT